MTRDSRDTRGWSRSTHHNITTVSMDLKCMRMYQILINPVTRAVTRWWHVTPDSWHRDTCDQPPSFCLPSTDVEIQAAWIYTFTYNPITRISFCKGWRLRAARSWPESNLFLVRGNECELLVAVMMLTQGRYVNSDGWSALCGEEHLALYTGRRNKLGQLMVHTSCSRQ